MTTALSFVSKDLGDRLKDFSSTTSVTEPVKISEVIPVASYSWIEAKTPTIAVPGMA